MGRLDPRRLPLGRHRSRDTCGRPGALAVLSSLIVLWTNDFPVRPSVALFWMCLAVTWLLAVTAAVAIQSTV